MCLFSFRIKTKQKGLSLFFLNSKFPELTAKQACVCICIIDLLVATCIASYKSWSVLQCVSCLKRGHASFASKA